MNTREMKSTLILASSAIEGVVRAIDAEQQEPECKVEYWKWDRMKLGNGKCGVYRSVYTFTGQPDWKRIIRKTFGEGAEVVRVSGWKGEFNGLSSPVAMMAHPAGVFEGNYFWMRAGSITDSDIEAAIREHHKADTPAFKVGDWVYSGDEGVSKVIRIMDKTISCRMTNGAVLTINDGALRLATPADYERTVDGVKVRVYECNDGLYEIATTDSNALLSRNATGNVVLAGLRALGIPVIPLSVSGGNFEAPKGE